MEEMKNLNVENTVTDVVEVATDKLTFRENLAAYTIAGIFAVGLGTVAFTGYKGIRKIVKTVRDKRESKIEAETIEEVGGQDIHGDGIESEENKSEE